MKDSRKIKAKKFSLKSASLNFKFKDITVALLKAGALAYGKKPFSALKEALSIISAISIKKSTENHLYNLLIKSYLRTSHELCEENISNFHNFLKDSDVLWSKDIYVKFLNGIDGLINSNEIKISYDDIINPSSISFTSIYINYFKSWLISFGTDPEDAKLVCNRFRSYFNHAMNQVWIEDIKNNNLILEALKSPMTEALNRDMEWRVMNTKIKKEFDKPVFKEYFSLRDIYIPLRCYLIVNNEFYIDKVEDCIHNFLEDDIKQILIVNGGPGTGKTSITKSISEKISRLESNKVIRIPLSKISIKNTLDDSIINYLISNPDISISHNVFNYIEEYETLILILDGLDELYLQGNEQSSILDLFYSLIIRLIDTYNNEKVRIKLVITSRPIPASKILKQNIAELSTHIILLPYLIDSTKKALLKKNDSDNLRVIDQRKEWWSKYCNLKNTTYSDPNTIFITDISEPLSTQPLLNYLCALVWQENKSLFSGRVNENQLYRMIIESVFKREYSPSLNNSITNEFILDEYVLLLSEIAIASWSDGKLYISMEELEKRFSSDNLKKNLLIYRDSMKTGTISNLLTSFYFSPKKKENSQRDIFEFTHKTFQEYLVSIAISNLLIIESNKESIDIEKTIEYLGGKEFNKSISLFFNKELENTDISNVEKYDNYIELLLNELIALEAIKTLSFQYKNTNKNLIRSVSKMSFILDSKKKLLFADRFQLMRWIHSIKESDADLGFLNYFNHIMLENCELRFSYFAGGNFQRSDFKKMNFLYSVFRSTDLSRIKLENSQFEQCLLLDCTLSKSTLIDVVFESCNLTETSFFGSTLSNVTFLNSNLSKVDFSNTTFDNQCSISAKSLSKAKSIKNIKGLSESLVAHVKQINPNISH